jgi:hypothetical protein
MKIKNSSAVPINKLREYIRFAKPSGVGKVHGIIVSPSRHASMTGKAFRTGVIYLKVGEGMSSWFEFPTLCHIQFTFISSFSVP